MVDVEAGVYSLIPTGLISAPPSIAPIAGKLSFSGISIFDFIVVIFAFLFVDLFDTLGTLIGVSTKAGFLDKEGKLPRIKGALFADALATTVGAVLGTSTVTTFVESASGVSDGGRSGLTALTAGVLFLVALLFSPILTTIPSFATTPALVVVGLMMVENVRDIRRNFLCTAEAVRRQKERAESRYCHHCNSVLLKADSWLICNFIKTCYNNHVL